MFRKPKKYLREIEHRLYIVFRFRNTVPYGKGRLNGGGLPSVQGTLGDMPRKKRNDNTKTVHGHIHCLQEDAPGIQREH